MLVRRAPDLKWRDVTPEPLYLRRREFLAAVPFALGAAGAVLAGDEALAQASGEKLEAAKVKESIAKLADKSEPVGPLVYFAYLELPVTEQVLDVDALLKGVAEGTQPVEKKA